ncbi:hypothetical protein FHX82_005316 [Amycolatopsis bartoniae]|uniref:Uncharacterized protein n=1 Tax=Amycolatopsis bartoniae TaxID=941986 RepID=A0A8H9M7H2_9PSEU|nr:hypothetical protein [Amycolatopsis bartoniae]MBB2938240.1 hypothetical protein [Amycolatopsis bartoniae]TVT09018.1 hypothetical protein FNH07_10280 [Amycolatopsis bartoniae]GHF33711.1 hypothetical protein GCM10017566_02940 [Amycolatopsis bartoniae]
MTKTLSEPDYVASALTAASLVPFPDPAHPWRLVARPGRIEVLQSDGDREALAACGAAVLNMQLALRAAGHAATVDLLPDRTRPDLLAVVWIRARCTPSIQERSLARAIPVLHEARVPRGGGPVPPDVRAALVRAAEREEADLLLLEPPAEVDALRGLLAEAGWLTGSGLAGLVAVLSSYTDTLRGQVRAGRALQRVLLTGVVQGARARVLLRPETVQKARPELRGFLGHQVNPQAVLAFRFAPAVPPRQRRS